MKKTIIFIFVIFSVFSMPSCVFPDYEEEPGIVYTDTPPESLFSDGRSYAQTFQVWVEKEYLEESKDLGRICWSEISQNENGANSVMNCANWYAVPARKFWGIKNGYTYVSSIGWYVVNDQIYLTLEKRCKENGTVLADICPGCSSPLGNDRPMIVGVR